MSKQHLEREAGVSTIWIFILLNVCQDAMQQLAAQGNMYVCPKTFELSFELVYLNEYQFDETQCTYSRTIIWQSSSKKKASPVASML